MSFAEARRIEACRTSQRVKMVRALSLVAFIHSVTGTPAVRDALAFGLALAENEGFSTQNHADDLYGIYRFGTGKRTIGLFGHCDVVPVREDEWETTSPFSPKIIGDNLFGRGVYDDKAGILSLFFGLKALKDLNIPLHSSFVGFLGMHEEAGGMPDVQNFIRRYGCPDVSLVADCDYPFPRAERSAAKIRLDFGKLSSVIDFRAGTMANAVPGFAEILLPLNGKTDILTLLPKPNYIAIKQRMEAGQPCYAVSAVGITAHAGHPSGGVSAIARLFSFLLSADVLPPADRTVFRNALATQTDFCGSFLWQGEKDDGKKYGLTCVSGIAGLTDGKELCLTYDTRFDVSLNTDAFADFFLKKAHTLYGASGEIEVKRNGYRIPENDPYAAALLKTYHQAGYKGEPYDAGGNTYSCYLSRSFSIGLTAPFDLKMLGLSSGKGGAHQPDEGIPLSAYVDGIGLAAQMILTLDRV
ncbi:MAG: M20/M25/M40 family metallo-hydrolase [Clostridia bacterium]|nr:M20/M25/M40 family metallo-hydrolase [Clostridia bacterium]